MSSLASTERMALCDLAMAVGPDAPTLCEGWAVKDLIAHCILREAANPLAIGIAVPQLAGVTKRAQDRMARGDFARLVHRLESGPPLWSPFKVPAVDRVLNGMEYFIHHEDVRRAQPKWAPRDLPSAVQDAVWRGVRSGARGLLRNAAVGIVARRSDTDETQLLKSGPDPVTVVGPPAELALFVFDRKQHARVDLQGHPEAISRLTGTTLGF